MVIGNGMIARRFGDYVGDDNFIIFASGVSNSKSTNAAEYSREFSLLKASVADTDKTLVYFSTTSVSDPGEKGSAYISHKLSCERFIAENAKSYVIFRVSNLVGRSPNPNTVLNFFVHHISKGISFNLWMNAQRNLIDVDDFYAIANYILRHKTYLNTIVNVANPVNYEVKEIVDTIAKYCGKKALYLPIHKGETFDIDTSGIQPIIQHLGTDFKNGYLEKMLEKYYG